MAICSSYIDGSSWLAPGHASGDNTSYCYPTDTNTSTIFGDYAWYEGNSNNEVYQVGEALANDLGIYDMSGNVLEFCWDFKGSYPSTTETNYTGIEDGSIRVMRGGTSGDTAQYLPVGNRFGWYPAHISAHWGFRIARNTQQQ